MSKYVQEGIDYRDDLFYEYIKVLVWGPGDPGADAKAEKLAAYRKRIQIRDVLRTKFPRAEIYFSEDPEMIKIAEGFKGQLRKEALQAKFADLVVMLDIGRGVDLELDYFVPTYPWFRDKVHVFLPEKYVRSDGLVNEIFKLLSKDQIEGFTQTDFSDCNVATKMAVQAALTCALMKKLRS